MTAPRMRMVRLGLDFAVVIVVVIASFAAGGGRAHAAATVNVGTIVINLEVKNDDGTYTLMNAMQELEFFNDANCRCNSTFAVRLSLVNPPAANLGNIKAQIWIGSGCDGTDITQRNQTCSRLLANDISVEDFHTRTKDLDLGAAKVMFPPSGTCGSQISSANTIWALIDTDGDQQWDMGGVFSLSDSSTGAAKTISFDTQPPSSVTNTKAIGVEDGFNVSWDVVAADVTTLRGYQVLCTWSKTGGPVFKNRVSANEYRRTLDVETCTVPPSTGVTPDAGTSDIDAGTSAIDAGAVPDAATATTPDAAASDGDAGTAAPGTFEDLDPRFICSGLQGGSATSARIDVSNPDAVTDHTEEDGIVAKVVAIDTARNYSVADVAASGAPVPVRDGWEYYHDQGGKADGGYCFVATAAYGDYDHPYVKVLRRFRDETLASFGWGRGFIGWYYAHSPPWADFLRAHPVARAAAAAALFPVVVLAAVWNELGPAGMVVLGLGLWALVRWWRRRRVVLAVAASVTALLLFVGSSARAQSWLDENEMRSERPGRAPPSWAFEFKLGPYYPDIDKESGVTGNPYATLFGSGSSLLLQAELDYFPFHPFGELGFGISAGYMSNSAKSFIEDQRPGDNFGKAICTDNTSACRSADDTTFKLFPVAFLIVYRFTELADKTVVPIVPYVKAGLSYYIWRITKGNGDVSSDLGQDGAGGTLGLQGTVGVSVRAERLDPDAARSMSSDLGVDHIGFFFELTYANVSGLGMSNKLEVGDLTWAAGLNFEF